MAKFYGYGSYKYGRDFLQNWVWFTPAEFILKYYS